MVVSCVCPSSEKNNSNSLNRMNGVMFPGNSPNYTDRSNINGPGTPRPLNRPKLSLSAPLTTNGLPESTDSKDSELQLSEEKGHRFVCFVFEEIEMHRNLRTVKGFIALFTIHKVEWTFYI